MPYSPKSELQESLGAGRERWQRIQSFENERAKMFGIRSRLVGNRLRNREVDDRLVLTVLINAARGAKRAEDKLLVATARWTTGRGGTWSGVDRSGKAWNKKQDHFRRLLELAKLDSFFTFERLLKLGELLRVPTKRR